MNSKKKSALGKGLSAILESPDTDITSKDISGNYVVGAVASISINSIETNPFQPRNHFDEILLNELSDSIREHGIIQPLTVRKLGYEKYQLISGERRLKASKLAELKEVPAYIRVANDEQMLEMALVENIQRANLNAIEIAISYQRLIEECELTQEKLGEKVGKSRSAVTNFLRLLKLPPEIQTAIKKKKITMGQARPLVNISDIEKQLALLNEIIEDKLSSRDIEQRVKEINNSEQDDYTKTSAKQKIELPQKYKNIKNDLTNQFNTQIKLSRNNKGKGSIVISFKSDTDFERILSLLNK
ncbi:MAG: ParB/RepB/Spo0J family partition protein [Bacteroidota bacterium]|nr:ParB/RepB/Spo0J family partition protein [Bacteroidota bacterium]